MSRRIYRIKSAPKKEKYPLERLWIGLLAVTVLSLAYLLLLHGRISRLEAEYSILGKGRLFTQMDEEDQSQYVEALLKKIENQGEVACLRRRQYRAEAMTACYGFFCLCTGIACIKRRLYRSYT